MAPREGNSIVRHGVLDDRLNVHGVKNLKVADLSICPDNVGCNTYSTALLIGEKCSMLVGEDLGYSGRALDMKVGIPSLRNRRNLLTLFRYQTIMLLVKPLLLLALGCRKILYWGWIRLKIDSSWLGRLWVVRKISLSVVVYPQSFQYYHLLATVYLYLGYFAAFPTAWCVSPQVLDRSSGPRRRQQVGGFLSFITIVRLHQHHAHHVTL